MRRIVWLIVAGSLCSQDLPDFKIDRIAAKYLYTEGPAWSRENFLIFSDLPANHLVKWVPGEGNSVFEENSNGTNGNTYDAQGRLYSCESHARRVVRRDKKGHTEVLADKWEGKKLNGPSDIAVRHDGEIYFTDPAFGKQLDSRELDFYGVFHISRKGVLELVTKTDGRPHGIAISPNGRNLYVSNADQHQVRTFDLDKSGNASNERVLIEKIGGVPGGIRVDEDGNLYVAEKHVSVFSPEGKMLREIPVPESPSNLAFGDPDLQTLYVTARTSVYRLRINTKGALQY